MLGMNKSLIALAIASSVALVGCGGAGDSFPEGVSPTAAGAGSGSGSSSGGNGSFFNDQDGVSYATNMGTTLSDIVSRALGSTSKGFSAAQDEAAFNDDPLNGATSGQSSNTVEQCDSGTVSSSFVLDQSDNLESASIVFNNCVIAGQTSTGTMTFTTSSSGNTETINITFDDFASSGPDGNSLIDGGLSMTMNGEASSSISGTQLTMVADGETTVFSDFGLYVSDSAGNASVGGQATIASSVDGTIQFSIDPALSGPSDGYPVIGTLSMVHSDGSALSINANTGNAETYNYSITNNGSTTTGTGNWADEDLAIPGLAYGG